MHLTRLDLEEFRLYRRASLTLDPAGLTITGDNGSGKSTLIEAVALLATMRSPRAGSDRELINLTSGRDLGFPPYARTIGHFERLDGPQSVEIGMQLDDFTGTALKKLVKVNGRPTRAVDAVGALKVVLFAPEDVVLASGPPSGRRRYLDILISQLDISYVRALSRYNRILEQRNSLLKQLGKLGRMESDPETASQLTFWDEELVGFGAKIIASRMRSVHRLAELSAVRFDPFGSGRVFTLRYLPSVGEELMAYAVSEPADQLQAKLALVLAERLKSERRDELRRGVTLAGPHRDDLALLLDDLEVGTYGSRGQQRLTLVALKLAESDLMTEVAGESPVVLLDDVLSELDVRNRDLLLGALAEAGDQMIVSAADPELLSGPQLSHLPRVTVNQGTITDVS